MGNLRTPEEIKASKIEATAKYLENAEKVLTELLGPLFGEDRIHTTDGFTSTFMCPAVGLRQLVMAMRRYPSFDISCLSAMKPFMFVQRVGSEDKKIPVVVPTFGVKNLNMPDNEIRFSLVNPRNEFIVGYNTKIYFDYPTQERNKQAVEAVLGRDGSWRNFELAAKVPTIPRDVRRRIEDARSCFDHMTIVWEAEWGVAPVVDPLIIGSVDDHHFLVDQYDVTKLERYISSEMTMRPLK